MREKSARRHWRQYRRAHHADGLTGGEVRYPHVWRAALRRTVELAAWGRRALKCRIERAWLGGAAGAVTVISVNTCHLLTCQSSRNDSIKLAEAAVRRTGFAICSCGRFGLLKEHPFRHSAMSAAQDAGGARDQQWRPVRVRAARRPHRAGGRRGVAAARLYDLRKVPRFGGHAAAPCRRRLAASASSSTVAAPSVSSDFQYSPGMESRSAQRCGVD